MAVAARSLSIKTFWSPSLGLLIFWVGAALLLVGAVVALFQQTFLAAVAALASILVLRMAVEALLVLFQIHDALVDLRDRGDDEAKSKIARARDLARRAHATSTPGENRLGPF